MYSLAAIVASTHKQPWEGVFKIADNLWWYIAVRNDHSILPEGDIVGTMEQITAARNHNNYDDKIDDSNNNIIIVITIMIVIIIMTIEIITSERAV